MKNIGINKPCSENWNEMSKNEQGAFCQKCASQVHDFTKKSSVEIKQTLLSLVGQQVCGRITSTQEKELNFEFEAWAKNHRKLSFQNLMFFSLLVVFGLSLFSCENEQDKEKIVGLQTVLMRVMQDKIDPLHETSIDKTVAQAKSDYIFEESQIMGMMDIDVIEEPQIVVEEIQDTKLVHDYGYAGGISYTERYKDFLVQELKVVPDEVDENGNVLPKTFEAKAFPNPAVEQTTIELSIPQKNIFEISLLDMAGKLIETIYNGELGRGKFQKAINLSNLNSGIYLIFINSSAFKESVRVVKN